MIHFAPWSPRPAIVQCHKGLQGTPLNYPQAHLCIEGMVVGAGFNGHLQGEMALDDCRQLILGTLQVYQEFSECRKGSLRL